MKKARNAIITAEFLRERVEYSKANGYDEKQKWIIFCEECMALGFYLQLYEARKTFSKYITVMAKDMRPFKVRFSNHMPIKHREINGDCDFFVGRTHLGVTTGVMALKAVKEHYNACVTYIPGRKLL